MRLTAAAFVGKTEAEIQALLAQDRATPRTTTDNGLKISEKGALSVYGLGRFPVTLYASQWATLIAKVPEIEAYLVANADKLKTKPEKAETV